MAKTDDPLFDPFDPAFRVDPYPVFERMRREDPVHWSPILKAFALTRHRDVGQVLRDPTYLPAPLRQYTATLLERAGRVLPAVDRLIEAALLFDATPGHREARRMMANTLNMRPLSEYAPMIAEITDGLIAGLAGRTTFDAVAEFADVLPVRVIHRLLGIPDEHFAFFGRTTRGLLGMFNYLSALRDLVAWEDQVREALDLIASLVRERRVRPREDGITRMSAIAVQDGIEDERLVARIMFLMMVGSDTTSASMGNAIRLALDTPEIQRASADVARMPEIVDELFRLEGTAFFAARRATRDGEVGGVAIAAGTTVYPYMPAANRDPEAYPDPDSFCPGRGGPPHMGFGDGAHACIGASLARLEARIGLHALFTRLPPLHRIEPDNRWMPLDAFRRLESLPVAAGRP